MAGERRKARRIPGSPPSPENPEPSNQIVEEHPDGSTTIMTAPPTPEVLAEYEEALARHPGDAGLHLHYAIALDGVGQTEAAIREARRAAEINPAWDFAHSMLAAFLKKAGQTDEAIREYREALIVSQAERRAGSDQGEAILRWSLAEALNGKGDVEGARRELERAIAIQREAVQQQAGSPSLLKQLEGVLAGFT